MNGIGDFVASIKETQRLAAQIVAELKGEAEGHPFRGNQYGDSGAGGKLSKAQSTVLKKMKPVDLQKIPDDMGRITPSYSDVNREGVIGQFNIGFNPIPDAGKFAKGSDGKFYGMQGRRIVEVRNPIPHILPNGEPLRNIADTIQR